MRITQRHFILIALATVLLCACEDSATKKAMSFPTWPSEEIWTYDTVDCSKLCCVPPEAITVKKAVEIGKALGSGGTTTEYYYIKGLVKGFNTSKHVDGMTGSYGNAFFYIQDNLKTNIEFYGYQVMGLNGAKFTSLDQLQIGDFVVIYSQITNYSGTIETTGKSTACITCTTNDLCYPEVDVPYYEENFEESLGEWTQHVVTDPGMTIWNQAQSATGITSAIGYAVDDQKVNHAGEVWLMSPAIDLAQYTPTTPIKLAFSTYYQHNDATEFDPKDYLRLKVSQDGTSWTDIEIPNFNTGKLPKYVSDTIDIGTYVSAGTRIAFAYKSSTAFAPKWSVKGISIFEHKRSRGCE